MSSRSYNNSLRTEQAGLTRARIVDAARQLLLTEGCQAMTIANLADTASVSVQTIYNAVGGKAAIVKAVWDATLAGDDDPRPMRDRPEVQAMLAAPDAPTMVASYASMARRIAERTAAVLAALLVTTDDDLRALVATVEDERLAGNTAFVTEYAGRFGLPADAPVQRAIDSVWTLTAPELYDRLVLQRSWSPDDYERWLTAALHATLTGA
jgi:AcrR family transcriptional regulator